ncbi:Putative hypothetical protein [Helicobacter mustelae 12198]|uniref:Uncharacterized protein n=1 Tax=Helicobacter mustelae (strain ATCC 43772 / CCUG 25715 / CIP 103759 / LMG 18044 / NCTC 12198 / R85-136P) TaxID=679897 RepID=D3UI78_HELM1|nr:Putative hypothetical protein [Helicobacter mustelae 12198]
MGSAVRTRYAPPFPSIQKTKTTKSNPRFQKRTKAIKNPTTSP